MVFQAPSPLHRLFDVDLVECRRAGHVPGTRNYK